MSVSPPTSKNGERGRSSPYGVVASAHFESGPPASKIKSAGEDGEVIETVKEEEWEERRKKTTTTTRNVERRVQRQLVLSDGEVVDDTGPVITEDATTDTVTKEVVSDQNQRPQGQLQALEAPLGEGWVATPGAVVISEKCTKTVKSHDEVEDEIETEEIQHCGDVTNKEAEEHVKGRSDLRELIAHRKNQGWALTKPQKRVVHEATRRKGNIDTVDVREKSKIQDGHVVTETERTVREEQYDNESAPDSGSSLSDGSVHEATKETSHNLVHTKDEDLLEYYAVPRGGTLAQGVKLGEGMHVVSEDVHEDRQGDEGEPPSEKLKRTRRPLGRKDALTRRPLDYNQEEETRKCETNRWLEHHFGSESGRSESSSQELEDSAEKSHTSGGNRITITMSPRPATPEDATDSNALPNRRWQGAPPQASSTPKVPPPPPPKPGRLWSSSPTHSPPPQATTPAVAHDILDEELAAARSRLRSTGMNLMEENKENNAPETSMENVKSSNRFQMTRPVKTENSISSLKGDVVFSSKFRSGKPKRDAPLIPDTEPPPLPSSPPPLATHVGRSQSFHIQTLPWSSSKKDSSSRIKSTLKDYRSEERLDDIDRRRNIHYVTSDNRFENHTNPSREHRPSWEKPKWQSKSTWSPPREATPPPPPRHVRPSSMNKNYINFNVAKEAATQTNSSPIPPPRTKRKKRPKSSYFFGQDNDSIYSTPSKVNGPRQSALEFSFSDNSYHNDVRHTDERKYKSQGSPKVERRYKTTKTITPVIVFPYEEKKSERFRDGKGYFHSTNKSSWTNTVDPRRRPRIVSEEEKSTTLPRKLANTLSFPKKTYLFGESDSVNDSAPDRFSNGHRGSLHNISGTYSDTVNEQSRFSSLNNRLNNRTGRPVGRSQSFNVQPGKSHSKILPNGMPLADISDQKSSSVYGSSPYVNLRSPNLIATIARTSSTRRLDTNESEEYAQQLDEEKRNRFMKGLLNTAPELFHFIHGNESEDTVDKSSQQRRDSPPNLIRPTVDVSSPYSPPATKSPSYSARIFTFGKGDNNTLTRSSLHGPPSSDQKSSYLSKEENLHRSSYALETNQAKSFNTSTVDNNKNNYILNNQNRKSTFNLKTSGGSLLYSPSFRNQQENEERRGSRSSSGGKERLSGDFTGKTNLSSGMRGESPVLIQIRDWNTR